MKQKKGCDMNAEREFIKKYVISSKGSFLFSSCIVSIWV